MNGEFLLRLNSAAEGWMPMIWRATWQGGIFIAVAWLLCRVFRKMPASARSWLWWVASLQLMIRLVSVATLPLPVLPAQELPESLAVAAKLEPQASVGVQSSAPVSTAPAIVKFATSTPTVPAPPRPSAMLFLALAWLGGFSLCVGFSLRRLALTRRMLRAARAVTDAGVLEAVEQFALDSRTQLPRLMVSEAAHCPLVAGLIRPTIVLPANFLESMDAVQQRMALAHELSHIRRLDLWSGIVPGLAQSIFFFHPLAWLASNEFSASCEAACDADALILSGGSAAAYARLLLDTAQNRSSMAVLGTAIGFRSIQRRISMLTPLKASNPRAIRMATTFVTAAAIVMALPWTVTAQSATKKVGVKPKPAAKSKHHKTPAKKTVMLKKPIHATGPIGIPPIRYGTTAAAASTAFVGTSAMPAGSTAPTVAFGVGTSRGVQLPVAARSGAAPPAPFGRAQSTGPAGGTAFGGGFAGATSAAPASSTLPSRSGAAAPSPSGFGGGGSFGGVPPMRTNDSSVTLENDLVSVDFDHVPLHQAIRELAKGAHAQYVLNSEVLDDTVTMTVNHASFRDVLDKLFAAVKQPLMCRYEDGVCVIVPKK